MKNCFLLTQKTILTRIRNDLPKCKIGITNLRETYTADITFQAQLDVILENLDKTTNVLNNFFTG